MGFKPSQCSSVIMISLHFILGGIFAIVECDFEAAAITMAPGVVLRVEEICG